MNLIYQRFTPRGIAAIDPQALGVEFVAGPPQPDTTTVIERGPLAVIDICGPLTHQPAGFDTYSAIEARFDAALARRPLAIVTRIASPGGDVSGAFDCARNMRRKAREAGIKWVAHSEAQACSAAYVLASAADEVWCSDSATIGSIGVIVQPVESVRADAAMGLSFATISSGARKADGNQHVTLSDEGRAAIQHSVDVMAGVFFEHVGQMRGPRLSADGARALEAGVRVGYEALAAGLVDGISGFAELCDRLCESGSTIALITAEALTASALDQKAPMADDKAPEEKPKEDAVRAGLVTAAASDDPEKAARAKKALAAYDSDENDDEKKKDEEAKAAAAAAKAAAESATLAQVAAQAAAAVAELAAMKAARESEARAALFASRPDLGEDVLKHLRTLPVETARGILAGLPKAANPYAPVRATATVGDPTVSAAAASTLSPEEQAKLDAAFGINPRASVGVVMNGVIQQFGVAAPVGSEIK